MRSIKHAAIMLMDGTVFTGKSHADCFKKIKEAGKAHIGDVQGFTDNENIFVTRDEAAIIASKAGQIEKSKYCFSEDFWSSHRNGKYDYDEINGYIEKVK